MQTYCVKHTDNVGSKKVIMGNKIIRELSRCTNCVADFFFSKKEN